MNGDEQNNSNTEDEKSSPVRHNYNGRIGCITLLYKVYTKKKKGN